MQETKLYDSSDAGRRYWWIGCLLALLVIGRGCADETWAATSKPGSEKTTSSLGMLKLQNGLWTAKVTAASLQHVMDEISRLSGARIVWLGQRDERQVSVEFTALPVADAMQRVLGSNNFLLLYASTAEEAKLTEIWVAPRHSAPRPPVPTTPDSAAIPDSAAMTEDSASDEIEAELEKMLESHLDTALHGTDRDSRIEAIGFLGGLVEHDPRIRPLLQQLSAAESDAQVRAAAAEVLAGLEE